MQFIHEQPAYVAASIKYLLEPPPVLMQHCQRPHNACIDMASQQLTCTAGPAADWQGNKHADALTGAESTAAYTTVQATSWLWHLFPQKISDPSQSQLRLCVHHHSCPDLRCLRAKR